MASRIAKGFHRVGVVLAAPLLMLGLVLSVIEWRYPTGPLKPYAIPVGTRAWHPDREPDLATRSLMQDQERASVEAPSGFLIVGRPLKIGRKDDVGANPFDSIQLDGANEWIGFELRDGRTLHIATTDENRAFNIALEFLRREKDNGRPYTLNDRPEFDGVRVAFATWYDESPKVQWPVARPANSPRAPDWMWAAIVALAGASLYVLARALGWVLDAFLSPAQPPPSP
jgi:hypothetical protein